VDGKIRIVTGVAGSFEERTENWRFFVENRPGPMMTST
jgi:hypothetical protein